MRRILSHVPGKDLLLACSVSIYSPLSLSSPLPLSSPSLLSLSLSPKLQIILQLVCWCRIIISSLQFHSHFHLKVSQVWNDHCSCSKLWRIKCSQVPLGLTPSPAHLWKRLYIADIKLKRNWRLGRSVGRRLESHSHRVLSVRVKEGEDIRASGSSDQTIKIWSLKDGRLLNTIYTHSVRERGEGRG